VRAVGYGTGPLRKEGNISTGSSVLCTMEQERVAVWTLEEVQEGPVGRLRPKGKITCQSALQMHHMALK
jgi:hypothetical protein